MLKPSELARLTIAVIVCSVGSGCAPKVLPASPSLTAAAQRYAPRHGRAAVYVIRPRQFAAYGAVFLVNLDHQEFGRVPVGSYLYAEVLPRSHELAVELATGIRSMAKGNALTFQAQDGRCHFFKVAPGSFEITVEPLSEEEGHRLIADSQLSGDNTFDGGTDAALQP